MMLAEAGIHVEVGIHAILAPSLGGLAHLKNYCVNMGENQTGLLSCNQLFRTPGVQIK